MTYADIAIPMLLLLAFALMLVRDLRKYDAQNNAPLDSAESAAPHQMEW